MAHQDETTRPGTAPDDWFHDPQIDETDSTTTSSDTAAERRFTVLSDTSGDDNTDDQIEPDWFDDDGTARVVPPVHLDPDSNEWMRHTGTDRRPLLHDPDSFDTRTARLRNHSTTAPAPAQRTWWQHRRGSVAVATSVVVLLGGAAVAGLWLTDTGSEPATPDTLALDEIVTTTAAPTTSSAPAAAGTAAANVTWCAGQAAGQPVTAESTDPGMAAIWRFEKAFYYDRDGAAARAAGAPDAVMASTQRLQLGIDALEPDIEFCVLADPVSPGIYDVTVVERGPGIDGRTAAQRFTIAETGGQALITAITSR